ncbi:MAG TPA: ester cyclase [Geodermatophilus sp.]|nr:ester cyclase [Geodermatophilus sp.]
MSAEENEALFQRFVATVNAHDPRAFDEFVAADYVEHSPDSPSGPAGLAAFLSMLLAGFPDVQATGTDVVAEEDKVAGTVRITGTHRGSFLGYPPTGRRVTITSVDLFRTRDGMLAEHWEVVDRRGIEAALGDGPVPKPPRG